MRAQRGGGGDDDADVDDNDNGPAHVEDGKRGATPRAIREGAEPSQANGLPGGPPSAASGWMTTILGYFSGSHTSLTRGARRLLIGSRARFGAAVAARQGPRERIPPPCATESTAPLAYGPEVQSAAGACLLQAPGRAASTLRCLAPLPEASAVATDSAAQRGAAPRFRELRRLGRVAAGATMTRALGCQAFDSAHGPHVHLCSCPLDRACGPPAEDAS